MKWRRALPVIALLLAACTSLSAAGAAEAPSLVALDGTTVTLPAKGSATVTVLNQGPAATLGAAAQPAGAGVSLSFASSPRLVAHGRAMHAHRREPGGADCRAPTVSTPSTVPTGATTTLVVHRCGKDSDPAPTSITVWSTAGGSVLTITIDPGTSTPVVAAPKKIDMTATHPNGSVEETFCLPGSAAGTVGLVTRDDAVEAVTLTRVKQPSCPSGTNAARLVVPVHTKAGTYTGSIDVNGVADGGVSDLTVSVRRSGLVFLLVLLIGLVVATLLSWWVRFGRPWGFVDEMEATYRLQVFEWQQDLQAAFKAVTTAEAPRFSVVCASRPSDAERPFDRALSDYRGTTSGIARMFRAPDSSQLAGGAKLTALESAATTYRTAASTARVLLDWWAGAVVDHAGSPTVSAVTQALTDPMPPGTDPMTTVSGDVTAAWGTYSKLRSALARISGIRVQAAEEKKHDVVQEADQLTNSTWSVNIADDAARTALVKQIDELNKKLGVPLEDARGLQRGVVEFVADDFALPGQYYVGAGEGQSPADALQKKKQANVGMEILVALVAGVVTIVSGFAALYVTNKAWGSSGDVLAAATWAVTAGAAVQVGRDFTTRITAS